MWIFATFIASSDKSIADAQSRVLPKEAEWELADWAFDMIEGNFGSFDIDLFASSANNKCEKFISWRRDPHAFKVDAFTVDWGEFYVYAFPPFSLVLRTLQKIRDNRAEGVVVVPFGQSSPGIRCS